MLSSNLLSISGLSFPISFCMADGGMTLCAWPCALNHPIRGPSHHFVSLTALIAPPPNPKASIHIQKYQFTAGIDTPENIGALSAEPNNLWPSFLIRELPVIYLQRNQMRRVDIVQNISGNIFQDFLWKLFRISSTCANLYSCS